MLGSRDVGRLPKFGNRRLVRVKPSKLMEVITMDKISGMTLTPAYGRDYKSKAEVLASLNKPEDWVANHFTGQTIICSIRDLENGQHTVRYKRLGSVVIVNVKDGKASAK
jgi:hypothetical protein